MQIINDSNLRIDYYVVVKIWDKSDIKIINHFKNLNWELNNEINDCFEFTKKCENMENAVNLFIIQKEFYEVECFIENEYFYNKQYIGCEYVENIYSSLKYIADTSIKNEMEGLNKAIKNLEYQIEYVKPVLNLPSDKLKQVLEFANSYTKE